MLDVSALALHRAGDSLADRPEGVRLVFALRNRAVGDETGVHELTQHVGQALVRGVGVLRPHVGDFRQDLPVGGVGGRREAPHGDGAHERASPDQLERGERGAGLALQCGEEPFDGLQVGEREPKHGPRLRTGFEFHHGFRDDAEGALRPDEELLQVVARVVFAKRAGEIQHPAVRQHDFEPQRQRAGVPVAEHVHASSVRGEHSTHLGAPFRGEGEREEAVGVLGRFRQLCQHHPGLDVRGVVDRVDGEDAVHAGGLEDDRAAVQVVGPPGGGRRPLDVRGVAALGDDDEVLFPGDPHHSGDLFGRPGAQHRKARALAPPAAVERSVGDVVGRREDVRRAEGGGEAVEGCRHGDSGKGEGEDKG